MKCCSRTGCRSTVICSVTTRSVFRLAFAKEHCVAEADRSDLLRRIRDNRPGGRLTMSERLCALRFNDGRTDCSVVVPRLGRGISVALQSIFGRNLLQRLVSRLLLLLLELLCQITGDGLVCASLVMTTYPSVLSLSIHTCTVMVTGLMVLWD